MRPHRQRLERLRPAWVALEGRFRMGLELDCPEHIDHRTRVWFDNPEDGMEPHAQASATVLEGEPEGFSHLTLIPAGDPHGCVFLGHWYGWVVDGELVPCLITGVAW